MTISFPEMKTGLRLGLAAAVTGFGGRCIILRPGNYPSLREMGLNNRLSSAREADRNARYGDDRYGPSPMPGQVTFYQGDYFQGPSFNARQSTKPLHSSFSDGRMKAVS